MYFLAVIQTCTFESGLCGWVQDTTDTLNWTVDSGGTSSTGTGPSFDHTTGAGLVSGTIYCKWTTDTLNWTVDSGGTSSTGTGPSFDHTTGGRNGKRAERLKSWSIIKDAPTNDGN